MLRTRKMLALLMATVMMMALLPAGAMAKLEPGREIYSGTCGENLTWTLDTSTGSLRISGSGEMTNYTSPSNVPWISYKNYIETLSFGSGVTSIGNYAFFGCTSLTSVIIGSGVMSIGDSAFNSCESLTSITIPDNVTSIGDSFGWCCSLTKVTIGSGVTSIAIGAFYHSTLLSKIVVASENQSYFSLQGVLFNKDCTELIYCPEGKTGSFAIPDGVTSIDSYAFSRSSLTSITIPDSVTGIGMSAFENCTLLASVAIPDSVTGIGVGAFLGCTSLTSVTIGNGVENISLSAFCDCTSLTSVYITDIAAWCGISFDGYSLSDYTSNPLYSAHNLYLNGVLVDELLIPDNVTSIGDIVFYGCTSLTSVIMPDSVKSIGNRAFCGCTSLTSATIPDSVTSIGSNAFYNCSSLTSVIIPGSVTSISDSAFGGCTSLVMITIPNSVTRIGNFAFYNCSSLASVTIPYSMTSFGNYAFYDCSSLTSAEFLGAPPMSFGSNVFDYCADEFTIYYSAAHASEWSPNGETEWNGYPIQMISDPQPQITIGDVNNDGEISFADVGALSGFALGLTESELSLEVADINGDGEITFADVGALYSMIIG